MSQSKFGFFVRMTEYERGWGQRPDGFVVFIDEAAANKFLEAEYVKRDYSSVPDYYIDYKKSGWRPITDEDYAKLSEFGKAYVD